MSACFRRATVPSGWLEYVDVIDHRYFYQLENERGRYTCGLIRNAVAEQLHKLQVHFADTNFLTSLTDFIDNPPVAGFMIEHAVLSSIRSNGLAIDAEIGTPMELRLLGEPPNFATDVTDKPVLYRPNKFNYKAIDGIIVLIKLETQNTRGKKLKIAMAKKEENAKPKLLMFPLQITLASSHSDSHARFFKEYSKWTRELSTFDVEIEFLWILPEWRENQEHESCSKWPKHKERYIPLVDVSEAIWRKYQGAKNAANAAK